MEISTVEEIRLLLKYIAQGYKVPKILYDHVMDVAVREIEEKKRVVLIKRDPDVSTGRFQGRYVKIISGATLEIHPTEVGPFGADFDGDMMAIYAPMSEEAQTEAKERMIKATGTSKINDPNFSLSKEMMTGIFTLTYKQKKNTPKVIKTVEEAIKLHIGTIVKIKYKGNHKTTAGRVVFNNALPKWYPFVDEPVDKKVVNRIVSEIIEKSHSDFITTMNKLNDVSFHYATMYPSSFGLDMMEISPELLKLKERLAKEKDPAKQSLIVDKLMPDALLRHMKKNQPELYLQIASGAAKGTNQIQQVMVAKGIIADPEGNILPPITKSISDGYSATEYFDASAGARKGIIDRSLNTAHGGYSYRKIVFVVGNVELNHRVRNCGTTRGLNLKLTPELFKKLRGRYIVDGRDFKPVTPKMVGQKIELRSPVFCTTSKICPTCYGELHKQLNTRNVGMVAAQQMNISEKIMKSFHLGGAVELKTLDLVNELMVNVDEMKRSKIEKNVYQKEDILYLKDEFASITIDTTRYSKDYIKIDKDVIELKAGYFEISFRDISSKLTIEQDTILFLTGDIEKSKGIITIMYGKDDKLFSVKPKAKDFTKLAQVMDAYVGGKSPWVDPESLYMKFFRGMFINEENYDSVHLEILLSNILRDSKDPQKPARLVTPYNPKLYSIKTLPSIISYPLGIAFENFNKSISYGMISERSPASPIEKVVLGETLLKDEDVEKYRSRA